MPQNVKKSSIWSPFLARGIEWRCFEVDEFFKGLLPVPFFVWNNVLWDAYFLLEQVDQFLSRLRAICARTLERSKTVFPNLYSFSKKCHKNENAVFNTAKWLRILMHPKLMHSNFEFSDAPDPKCLCAPRALLVFWSKKILSEIDFVLISVWQFKLDELEIACLKDQLDYPWIGFSLPVEKWLQVGLN